MRKINMDLTSRNLKSETKNDKVLPSKVQSINFNGAHQKQVEIYNSEVDTLFSCKKSPLLVLIALFLYMSFSKGGRNYS